MTIEERPTGLSFYIERLNMNRIQTGPLKINDDWTGMFIRGDDALFKLLPLLTKVKTNRRLSSIDKIILDNLIEQLSLCNENLNLARVINSKE
jgi:hypothetical protein